MTSIENLIKQSFLQRFAQLQVELGQTLKNQNQLFSVTLQLQNYLISNLENWINVAGSLHSLPADEMEIFRETLSINREVFRMKLFRLHNLDITEDDSDAVHMSMQKVHKKILSATIEINSMIH
ncbi:hypothetical protein ACO0K0_20240 [Undibacterium sp. SXout11W]|uniref:hypothetical protein n=1 Tax=Undibacterium sp. SXout11W TaxID=3413050 RepID=UPI003BEF7EF7